jgi:polyhydroxyalkanoate synthesis repressor PhaR
MTTTQTATATLIVKRYANRKLYNTEASKYMTLGQLVEVVASGREVQVIENVTKNDITGQTLLQALVETEADAAGQTATLRGIFVAGGLAKWVQTFKATTNE